MNRSGTVIFRSQLAQVPRNHRLFIQLNKSSNAYISA
uniref:Uncharacterized protein n=1 Tax=Anguilla anguilla TaxID=7936 RepID=A0A0E9RF26_ANGAN